MRRDSGETRRCADRYLLIWDLPFRDAVESGLGRIGSFQESKTRLNPIHPTVHFARQIHNRRIEPDTGQEPISAPRLLRFTCPASVLSPSCFSRPLDLLWDGGAGRGAVHGRCLDGSHRLYTAALLRFLRLFRHGDRRRPAVRHPLPGEFQLAL